MTRGGSNNLHPIHKCPFVENRICYKNPPTGDGNIVRFLAKVTIDN